jgi:two-component system chemotaxis sensor kinase CheA
LGGTDADLDRAALLEIICAPGFSTREEADRASGRGVGMAVVKNTILELGGSLALDTEVGRGTRFTIQLPLTLAITDSLIVAVGGQRFAVPQASVREVMAVEAASIKGLENNEIIPHRGGVLPLVRLARLFGLAEGRQPSFHAFVVGNGLSAVGIAVDRILGQREIVVRAITDPLIKVAGVAGATELGDGRAVLILDTAAVVKKALGPGAQARAAEGQTKECHRDGQAADC